MRTRIKTRVVVSDAITEMEMRSQKKREWFNQIIVPIAHKYVEQGVDWITAKKFALAEYNINQSFNRLNNQSYGTV
jgi:hypothetical protein